MRIEFRIPCIPVKRRPKAYRRGKGVGFYKDDKTMAEMLEVRAAYAEAAGGFRFDGPVALRVDVYGKLPASRPKRVGSEPFTFKPDVDNVAKCVMDALNGVAWDDDRQVTGLVVAKHRRRRDLSDSATVTVMDA